MGTIVLEQLKEKRQKTFMLILYAANILPPSVIVLGKSCLLPKSISLSKAFHYFAQMSIIFMSHMTTTLFSEISYPAVTVSGSTTMKVEGW